MHCPNFDDAVDQILREDDRYDREAYLFLQEALDCTIKILKRPADAPRHVSGRELNEGIRHYAITEFGPVAKRVLNAWGIRSTEDFGEIVFNLVGKGVLGKTESDRKEDFADGFDFDEAFVRPFLPESVRSKPVASGRRAGMKQESSLN